MSEASPVVDNHDLRPVDERARVKPSTSFELPPPIPLLPFSRDSSYPLAPHPAENAVSAPPERQALAPWQEIMASPTSHGHRELEHVAGQQQEPPLGRLDAGGAAAVHLPSIVEHVGAPAQSHLDRPPFQAMNTSPKTLLARRARLSTMSIALPPPLTGHLTSPAGLPAFARAPSPPRVVETSQVSSLAQQSASFASPSKCLSRSARQHSQSLTRLYPTWSSGHAPTSATSVTAASSYPPLNVGTSSRDTANRHLTNPRTRDVAYTPYSLHGRPPCSQFDGSPPCSAPLAMPAQESRAYSAALAARNHHLTAAAHEFMTPAPPLDLAANLVSNGAGWHAK